MNKAIIAIIVVLAGGIFFAVQKPAPRETTPSKPIVATEPNPAVTESAPQKTFATSPTPAPSEIPATATKEFTVTESNFSFTPASIAVSKGDHVKITFKNSEGFHDWKIDELGLSAKKIKAGEETVMEFTADKVGTFEYYCSVGEHREKGMKGTLTVQ